MGPKTNLRPNHPRPSQRGEPFDPHVPGIDYGVLDELVGYALRRAQIRIYEDFVSALAPWSMTPQRFSAMTIIRQNPGLKLTELAEVMGIARSGAVQVVNALDKLGYARRDAFADDKRAYAVVLTSEGKQALDVITAEIRRHDTRISSRLSRSEQAELRRLLDLLG